MPRLSWAKAWAADAALAPLLTGRNPDGSIFTIPVTNTPAELASIGRGFIVGSGRLTLSVAGNVRAILRNPAASGRNVIVAGLSVFGTGVSWASIYLNPTAGVPATANRVGLNAIAGGGDTRVGELRVDTDTTVALGGGLDTGIVLGSGGGDRTSLELPFPIVIAQGVTLGINVPFAGAADATLSAYLVEVDA